MPEPSKRADLPPIPLAHPHSTDPLDWTVAELKAELLRYPGSEYIANLPTARPGEPSGAEWLATRRGDISGRNLRELLRMARQGELTPRDVFELRR
ncbi:hypothetical protein AB0E01_00105 [Nocardia vinacea]|uniref:hypothetical protein n=1 Tax=Nocardia vinacea TaxID=96468 RepID=UPI0033E74B4E